MGFSKENGPKKGFLYICTTLLYKILLRPIITNSSCVNLGLVLEIVICSRYVKKMVKISLNASWFTPKKLIHIRANIPTKKTSLN